MSKLSLILACGDYDIVRPLSDGAVRPDGIDLNVLTDIDSTTRHWRFLRNGELKIGRAFERAKAPARSAWPIDGSCRSRYREVCEEQERLLGHDPWRYGLSEQNRNNLEILIGYAHEQGLIRRKPAPEDLFIDVFQGRKRGEEYRI